MPKLVSMVHWAKTPRSGRRERTSHTVASDSTCRLSPSCEIFRLELPSRSRTNSTSRLWPRPLRLRWKLGDPDCWNRTVEAAPTTCRARVQCRRGPSHPGRQGVQPAALLRFGAGVDSRVLRRATSRTLPSFADRWCLVEFPRDPHLEVWRLQWRFDLGYSRSAARSRSPWRTGDP